MVTVLTLNLLFMGLMYLFGYSRGLKHAREEYEELMAYYTKRVLELQERNKK